MSLCKPPPKGRKETKCRCSSQPQGLLFIPFPATRLDRVTDLRNCDAQGGTKGYREPGEDLDREEHG